MGTPSTLEAIALLADLAALAMAGGLIFAILVEPRVTSTSYLFVGFAGALGAVAFLSLILRVNLSDLQPTNETVLTLRLLVMVVLVAAYYAFMLVFINPSGRLVRIVTLLGVPAIAIATVLLLTGNAVAPTVEAPRTLAVGGYGMLALSLAYLGFAFWQVISSPMANARLLLLPTILLIAGYALNAIPVLAEVGVDMILMTIAAGWSGWALLHNQIFNPLNELNQELRVANRDLQQVINDLEKEKTKSEELNENLRAANTYKSEFLANMSHELRTPLNSIIGYSELLRKGIYGELSEKQSDRMEKIHRNGAQLLDVISDILDLNKIEAGKLRLDTGFFPLRPVVETVAAAHRETAETKSLRLMVDLPDDMPTLYGDEARIRQVLGNIIENAVKFTADGQVTVTAYNFQVTKGLSHGFQLPTIGWLRDGSWVVLAITDTGIGIAPEDQARIFEEFSQVDGSHTREYGGTGLGLAIAKRLVVMHDGTIWVKSRLGEGSTFFIALPTDVKSQQTMPSAAAETAL